MRIRKTFLIFTFSSLLALSAFAQDAGNSVTRPELTIPQIMQGKKFVGFWPRGVHWSEDGRNIYFRWNPENADSDSLYVVAKGGGALRKVTPEELSQKPAQSGDYNRRRTHKVYARDGDIFLLKIKSGKEAQITNTLQAESNPEFTSDENSVSFIRDRNLYLWNIKSGVTEQVTDFRSGSDKPDEEQPDNENEQWVKKEQLRLIQIVRERKEKAERAKQTREEREPKRPLEIYIQKKKVSSIQLGPAQRFITFSLENEPEGAKRTVVPDYVTESGYTDDLKARPKVGSPLTTYELGIYDRRRDTVYYLATDSIPGILDEPEYLSEYDDTDEVGENEREADSGGHAESETVDESDKPKPREVEFRGPFWSDDGQRAFVDAFALDYKDRWLLSLDLESGELTPLERQHDEAWIGGPGIGWLRWPPNVGWLPDNRHIWFKSEESGYSHLYTLNVITGEKKALTSGSFEVSHATLARNKKSWYFISNETHPGERHFYRMPLAGGDPVKITSMTGRNEVYPSPDEKTLAILSSYSNKPWELYVQNNRPGAKSKQLTSSLRDEFAAYPWRDPEIIDFTARDGATVLARLYRPVYPEAQGPAVVFVHGAGYLQNAHKWWSSYYREYMFHNLLADHGYTVLDIDYRASAGYGRDWRAAIYRSMGGRDLSDQVDGARFLVERYDVDSSRIGIYGGSYGGFITFMALFTEPGVFAAGAALRPVTDWAHYNHGYTAAILNIPQKDSIAFVRSSPIYHAEGLEDALLICHGVVDPNVHFQDVVRLIQRLIELGKENWEVAIYPVEGHGFREPSSWTDEYRRVFKLFEENLK